MKSKLSSDQKLKKKVKICHTKQYYVTDLTNRKFLYKYNTITFMAKIIEKVAFVKTNERRQRLRHDP